MEDYFKSEEFLKFIKQTKLLRAMKGDIHCSAPFYATRFLGDTMGVCHNHHDEHTDRIKLQDEIMSEELNEKCRYCEVRHKYSTNKYLEIILGNNCNNNCKICLPIYSKNISTIENIANPIGEFSLSDKMLSEIKKAGENVKEVEFIGGETFLYIDQILSILDDCRSIQKIHMVTNGSFYNERFFEYLINRKIDLNLYISIDGTPQTQNYMRGGSNYDNVISNIKKYNKHMNVNCCINTAVSILNVLDINKVVGCIQERIPHIPISTTVVHTPMEYSLPNVQDNEIRKKILTELEKLRYNDRVINKESLISFAETKNEVDVEKMIKRTVEMLDAHDSKIGKNSIDYMNKNMYNYIRRLYDNYRED